MNFFLQFLDFSSISTFFFIFGVFRPEDFYDTRLFSGNTIEFEIPGMDFIVRWNFPRKI